MVNANRISAGPTPHWAKASLHSHKDVPSSGEHKRASADTRNLAEWSGNQSRLRKLANPALQQGLAIGLANDPLEAAADRMAEQVMRTSTRAPSRVHASQSQLSCECAHWEKEEQKLRTKSANPAAPAACEVPGIVHEVLRSAGQPLDSATRSFMEPRFGCDLSKVRVHTDAQSVESADAVRALAYTVGRDVVFGAGQYSPATQSGRWLLAHELAHAVQGSPPAGILRRQPGKKHPTPEGTIQPTHRRNQYEIQFTDWVFDYEAVTIVFRDGKIPQGFRLANAQGSSISTRWTLTVLPDSSFESLLNPGFAKQIVDFRQHDEAQETINESESIKEARAEFRKRHNGHEAKVLDNIDAALKRITQGNPDLLLAYYNFYSDHKLTDKLESSSQELGVTDLTFRRGIYTDLNIGLLHLERLPQAATDDPLSLLGGTLIHEYSHTPQGDYPLKGPTEGKAYGIENFFAQRMGDKLRDAETVNLGPKKGDESAFRTAYGVMKELYEIIDNGTPSPNLKGVTADEARWMTVEFISENKEDFGESLKRFISAEFKPPLGLGSLP